ncbi:MAG: UvrD-helicase domain-containing protein [Candidatus Komeilibacteria bacterium]|nr:UvrD-helicase domain-containing protein [Candidatus Komeilibacteria bacterium]
MTYEDKLNPEQKRAVEHDGGPLLIVAGAGTGKTTVITERINFLITKKNLAPNQILALTFTEKAAAEMEERVDKALPYGYTDLWISTFHAFSERILHEHGLDIGLTTEFKLLNQTEAWLLVRNNLDKFELDYYRPLGNPNKFIHALLKHFSKAKDELVKPSDYLAYAESYRLDNDLRKDEEAAMETRRLEEIANAYHVYQQLLLDNNYLDFGDLINYCYELFLKRPQILKKYQDQFKYVLVDEFQDTNYAQYQLIKLLAQPRNNITVVGDDDQCLPAMTRIATPVGDRVIKNFKVGDEILTAVGKGHIGISTVSRVFKNTKKVIVLTITTKKGFKVKVTDNHKMFCRVPSSVSVNNNYVYVYLMWRQDIGWRLGITKNLAWRLALERSADKIIGIKACGSETEARFYEALFSLKYSIPTYCFKQRKGLSFDEDILRSLYSQLSVEESAKRLAIDLNIDLKSSHVCLAGVTRGNKNRLKINLEMCYRNHRSKDFVRRGDEIIKNSLVQHQLSLQTSQPEIIKILRNNGFTLQKTRIGYRLRIVNSDLKVLGKQLERLEFLTNGMAQVKANIGRHNYQHLPSLVIPAKNLLLGHYLPVKVNNNIIYDEIIEIKSAEKSMTVYDLEVKRTHNFLAEGVVVHNSIYKFRGASISNILEFKKDFAKCLEVYLTTNYRTKQNILDVAYKFIQLNNPNRLEAQLQLKKKKTTATKTTASKLTKELKAARTGSGVIQHIHASTLEQEVAAVVNKIGELSQKEQGLSWSDFAILVRANDQSKPFIEAMERAGVPYQFVASRGLYAKPVVLSLIAFLKLLDNYHESDAMYRYLTLPMFNLDQVEIIKITHEATKKRWTLWETARQARAYLRLSDTAQKNLDHALVLLDKYLARAKNDKTSRIVFDFLNESNFLKYIDGLEEGKKRQLFGYLGQFYKRIKAFEEINDNKTVKNFLNQLGLELESGEQGDLAALNEDEGPEMVKVMTVHSAKGLEFKYVFLVNLVDQRFPTRQRTDGIELPDKLVKEIVPEGDIHLQEERRLFYVGITRARDGLFLTSAQDYGGVRKKKISVFLSDLGFKQPEVKSVTAEKLESVNQIKSSANQSIKEFLPSKFSFTQIKDFQNCPRGYYYKYILKIPLKGNNYFSFGSSVHLALQKFFEEVKRRQTSAQGSLFGQSDLKIQRGPSRSLGAAVGSVHKKLIRDLITLAELIKFYEDGWIEDWYGSKQQKEDYFKQGKEILKNFYHSKFLEESAPVYLEKMFMVKINGYNLTGKIDRLDQAGNGLKIIDYKTGKPKEKLEAEDKEQLLIYQLAAGQLFQEPIKELAYYYLENDTMVPFLGTDKETEKLLAKISQTIEEIKNFDFVGFVAHHEPCDYCKDII